MGEAAGLLLETAEQVVNPTAVNTNPPPPASPDRWMKAAAIVGFAYSAVFVALGAVQAAAGAAWVDAPWLVAATTALMGGAAHGAWRRSARSGGA